MHASRAVAVHFVSRSLKSKCKSQKAKLLYSPAANGIVCRLKATPKFCALIFDFCIGATNKVSRGSGKRVRNTLVTYPEVRNNPAKAGLIPDVIPIRKSSEVKPSGALGGA